MNVASAQSQRYTGPKRRTTIDGPEKFCTKCMEWWPADLEFFFSTPKSPDGLFYCCKACYYDMDKRPGRGVPDLAPMIPPSTASLLLNFGGYQ